MVICCRGYLIVASPVVFMGSEKYPGENAFDVFTHKHGGFDNASTDYNKVCLRTSKSLLQRYRMTHFSSNERRPCMQVAISVLHTV